MKAIYKGKEVKVTKLILSKSEYITKPILVLVRIEWKDENGIDWSDYADANLVDFDLIQLTK